MIVGHKGLLDGNVTQLIFSFHMPLFFLISGMFWKETTLLKSIKSITRTLLIPFSIIALTWCFYYLALYLKNGLPINKIIPYIVGSFISPGKVLGPLQPLCIYLWFLYAMTWIKIFASLCNSKRLMILLSIICIMIVIFIIEPLDLILPFALDSALLAFPFFTIGHIASFYLKKNYSTKIEITVFIVTLIITIFLSLYNGTVDINNNLFGESIILFIICGISGSLMILSVSKISFRIAKKGEFIDIISTGTLLIVGYSAMLTGYFLKAFTMIFNQPCNSNLIGLIIGMFVLISFYPMTLLCKKYFPAIIGFRN